MNKAMYLKGSQLRHCCGAIATLVTLNSLFNVNKAILTLVDMAFQSALV